MEGPGLEMRKGARCSDCRGVRGLVGCALSRGVCSRRVSPWREVVTTPVFAESTFLCWVPQGGGFRSGAAGSHCLAAALRGSGYQRGNEGPARMLWEPGRGCQGATGGGREGPGHALWSLVRGLDVSRAVALEP